MTGIETNVANHLLDFLGGRLSAVRKGAHFIGDHGKAASGVPGTGRFNGRIEGQQISLFGDAANHIQHLADVLHPARQLLDVR